MISLTIGSFDGLHLGHQKIIEHITAYPTSTLLTFINHPLSILAGKTPPPLICSPEYKLYLLKQTSITNIIVIPFTQELSQQSYDTFLRHIHKQHPFTALILGKGALLGHNREGTPERLQALGNTLGFTVTYIDPCLYQGTPISSGRVRPLIEAGNLQEAAALLGRPYSLYGTLPANILPLQGLCHPPSGTYPVTINGHITTATIENNTLHLPFPYTTPVVITFHT